MRPFAGSPRTGATNSLAEVEDPGHEAIRLSGVQEEEHEACSDDELDHAEHEHDDAPAHLVATGTGHGDPAAIGAHDLVRGGAAASRPGP